jgi:hypothetical protein
VVVPFAEPKNRAPDSMLRGSFPLPAHDKKTEKIKLDADGNPIIKRLQNNPTIGVYKQMT